MFQNPFSFNGRIRRTEYGLSFIIYFGYYFIMVFTLLALSRTFVAAPVFLLLLLIPAIWFILAQGVKRSHDAGTSGWFILIPFYPLYLLFADSEHGSNKWGNNPKGIGNIDEIDRIGQHLQETNVTLKN